MFMNNNNSKKCSDPSVDKRNYQGHPRMSRKANCEQFLQSYGGDGEDVASKKVQQTPIFGLKKKRTLSAAEIMFCRCEF